MDYTYEIAKALERKNEIEEQKLEFEKKVFEFNKQLNIDDTKANTSMSETLENFSNMFQGFNDTIKMLSQNQAVLYQQMQDIKACLAIRTVQTTFDEVE